MQQIQWYPGHMHKASKEMKKLLPEVDLIIEVLDARIPFSSENPMIRSIRGDKPCIKVLSKSDLADPERTALWQEYLEQEQGVKTLAITTDDPSRALQITELCRKMLPHKYEGVKSINAMIMGIPNVGKSTLINLLAGRTIAKTGNEPAVTKGQQRINLRNGIVLHDTPGVLWANLENRNTGYRLAVTGAIKDTAIDHDDVAFFAADFLLANYPEQVAERYGIAQLPDEHSPSPALELLELIGARRGCLGGGGRVDLDKVSKILLTELRAGTVGPLTLETPAEMEQEVAELDIIRAKKEAKKQARKQRRKGSN
ncbi:ribosome biogenesis GTPase YlqF [bacterium SCSIO 12696]|nr:ribosome biogenesis GTPase YlqF [bacterium SCSIO 12696]